MKTLLDLYKTKITYLTSNSHMEQEKATGLRINDIKQKWRLYFLCCVVFVC